MPCFRRCRCREASPSQRSRSARPVRRMLGISPPRCWPSAILHWPRGFAQIGMRTPSGSENRMRDLRSSAVARTDASPPSNETFHLGIAAKVLRHGGIVAHATEGVWGLACDPFDADAVVRLLDLKGRSV